MLILKRPIITVLFIYVFVIILLEHFNFFSAQNNSYLIHNINQQEVSIVGKVLEQPTTKKQNQQFIFEVNSINDVLIREKTLVNISTAYNVNYGDVLCLTGKLSSIDEPLFPNIFNYKIYLQREKIYTKFYTYEFEFIENKSNKIKLLSFKVRDDISLKFNKYFNAKISAVLKSMFVGDKTAIDVDTKNDFVNSGLIHILVISGLHIGFIVGIFLVIFRLLNLPLKIVYLLTIPAIFFYAIMTGSNPPAIRATIMASCILLSFVLNRESLIYNSICLAALIILFHNPQCLFTASMQLSFIATIGIIYLYPKIIKSIPKVENKFCKYFMDIFCVTISVQIALTPILVFYFGKLSIISFVANLLIVPIVGFIVALSFVFYIFTFISGYVSLFISGLLSKLLTIILFFIHYFANLNFAVLENRIPSLIEILLYYVIVVYMFELKNRKKYLVVFLIICMFIVSLPEKNFYKTFENDKNLTIHIRQNSKDKLVINEKKKDKFYFSNLQQYLLFGGIKQLEEVYTNNKTIKEQLPKVNIKQVYELKEFNDLK